MNDDGTMVQVAVTDLAAYFDDEITAMPNLVTTAATTVGALNSGSITSGFGAIDNGSSAITTTGTITGGTVSFGSITDGTITATAFVDEDNMSSNSATLIPTQQSVKAYVDSVNGTANNVTGLNATGAELNTVADFSAVSVDTSTAIASNDALLVFDNGNEIGYRDVDLLDTYFSGTTKTLTNKTLTSPIVTGMHLNDSGFTVEGSAADGNETTVTFTNPTADHTITFPNATGTVALSNSSSATFGGNGSTGGVTLQDGRVDIRTGTGSVAAIRFYCESSNAHYTELKSAAHSAYSGNLSFVLPAADGSSGQFLKTDGSGNLAFAAANNYVHPNHTGEVTSTADGATVIADNIVDEANLKVSNSPSNGYVLTAQSGNTGGLTWAEAASGAPLYAANESSANAQPSALGNNAIAIGNTTKAGTQASHANAIAIGGSDTTSQPVQATNTHAVAIGTSYAGEVTASGDGSMAIGTGATVASSGGALALGRNAAASGGSSVSMGRGSAASALYAAALGYNAVAAGSSSMALVNSRAGSSGAFAAGIDNNTSSYGATGQNSVALGYQSKASGQRAFSVGSGADASGTQAIALGGNTASGAYSATIGGSVNTSSGEASYAFGKRALAAQDGKYAYGAQLVSTTGATQGGMMILVAATTDATATILRSDTNSADADNQIVAAADTAITFDGSVTGIQNGAQAFASFLISGLLVNDGGTTTLVNSATTVIDNQSSWTVAMSADNTNNALAITVTGEASHNIRWVANIRTSEVTYA